MASGLDGLASTAILPWGVPLSDLHPIMLDDGFRPAIS